LLLLLLPLACGADATLRLGQGDPVPIFGNEDFGREERRPRFINSEDDDDNPTLTEDLLNIFFTSDRDDDDDDDDGLGSGDVYWATRNTRADPFGKAVVVAEVSTEDEETSAAISPDGLTLWVGSDRDGGVGDTDIWQSTRPTKDAKWSTPINLTALNSEQDDIPRPVGQGGLVMPMASRRGPGDDYQTYLATRPSLNADFGAPEPLSYLWVEGGSMVDAFLTDDGLFLFFNWEFEEGKGDLYMAWRLSTDDLFRDAVPLTAVNSDADERDPWLSVDGTRFFFSSNRRESTELDIYFTPIELPRFE
jgi:hypothetical protein